MHSLLRLVRAAAPGIRVIAVRGNDVQPLRTPDEFHTAIRAGVAAAQRRITLAALYIGTGPLELQLLQGTAFEYLLTHAACTDSCITGC
jgi:hypothetical protein